MYQTSNCEIFAKLSAHYKLVAGSPSLLVSKESIRRHLGIGVVILALLVPQASLAETPAKREKERNQLKNEALTLLEKHKDNHCKAFTKSVDFAVSKTSDVMDLLEDLRLVFIGEDWLRRKGKRGPYYINRTTSDSGFKSELKDGSPQIEHAMAGIYLSKSLPPGGVGSIGSFTEFVQAIGRKPNTADMLLYGYGEDLGGRLAKNNMKQFPQAVEKTLCE